MNPVRVRGKKYRKKPTKSAKVPKVDGSASLQDASSKLKRSNTEPASPGGAHKRSRVENSLQVTESAASLSPLERLPVEILEPIFLHSLNLSLPQASPLLGRKLATKHVKSSLFLEMFPKETGHSNFDFLLQTLGSLDALGVLQSQVLGLRWMTPDFIREMLEDCTVRSIVQFFNQHKLGWADLERNMPVDNRKSSCSRYSGVLVASKEVTADVVRSFYKQHVWSSGIGGEMSHGEYWTLPNESADIEVELDIRFMQGDLKMSITDISAAPSRLVASHELKVISCVRHCRIPQRYLHGPWSTDKWEQLIRIVGGGGRMDLLGRTTDEEVAEKGLEDAIAEHNHMALHTLIGRACWHSKNLLKPSHRSDIYESRDERIGLFGNQHVGVVVYTKHFKMALDHDCSYLILNSLADSMNLVVDWEDKEIMAWTVRKSAEGDMRGQWLEGCYGDARIDLPLLEEL